MLLYQACTKKAFSGQIRHLLSEEKVWSVFQARETAEHNQCTESIGQPLGSFTKSGRVLSARVDSWSKPELWMASVHGVDFPLHRQRSHILVWCTLLHLPQAWVPLAGSVLLGLVWERKAFSGQIRLLLTGEHICSGFQDRETCYTQPVHGELWAAPWFFCQSLGVAKVGKRLVWLL